MNGTNGIAIQVVGPQSLLLDAIFINKNKAGNLAPVNKNNRDRVIVLPDGTVLSSDRFGKR